MQGMNMKDQYAKYVLYFQVLQIGPSFPYIAFPCVAIWSFNFISCIFTPRDFDSRHFQVLHFQSTRFVCMFISRDRNVEPPSPVKWTSGVMDLEHFPFLFLFTVAMQNVVALSQAV